MFFPRYCAHVFFSLQYSSHVFPEESLWFFLESSFRSFSLKKLCPKPVPVILRPQFFLEKGKYLDSKTVPVACPWPAVQKVSLEIPCPLFALRYCPTCFPLSFCSQKCVFEFFWNTFWAQKCSSGCCPHVSLSYCSPTLFRKIKVPIFPQDTVPRKIFRLLFPKSVPLDAVPKLFVLKLLVPKIFPLHTLPKRNFWSCCSPKKRKPLRYCANNLCP